MNSIALVPMRDGTYFSSCSLTKYLKTVKTVNQSFLLTDSRVFSLHSYSFGHCGAIGRIVTIRLSLRRFLEYHSKTKLFRGLEFF